jgi:hypothetical protein
LNDAGSLALVGDAEADGEGDAIGDAAGEEDGEPDGVGFLAIASS